MSWKRRALVWSWIAGWALGVLSAVPARAQAPADELKLSVAVGGTLPLGRAATRWAELLGANAIAVKTYPGAALAQRDASREFIALREGAADLAVGSALQWSAQVPALGVYAL